MNFKSIGSGTALSAYVSALLAKSASTNGSTTTGTSDSSTAPVDASTKAAATAALAKASQSFKSVTAQKSLDRKELALATDLKAALSHAGVKLGASVEMSVGTDGQLALKGSAADKAAITAFMKSDPSQPSFGSRVASLATEANALSATIRQSAAISQAATSAGHSSGVMSLYTSLLAQQDKSPATFSISSTGMALTYPGMLASSA